MTLEPPSQRPLGAPLTRLLVDYNPFYLLSAGCMLFGVFALNDSLDWSPIPLARLLTMIFTLNLYELIVIGLAIFLLKRGIKRDALLLLIVEAFFLADVGFLNMEVYAKRAAVGIIVNAFLLIAAGVKIAFIFRAAGIPLVDPRLAFVMTQIGVLFAIPGLFAIVAQRHNDFLSPLVVYCGWWITGALPIAYVMTVGSLDVFRKRGDGRPIGADVVLSRVLLALPMVSLIAHLCLANWVYKVTFHPLNLAPLLIGFAVLCGHCDRHVTTLAWRLRMHLTLPAIAIVLSSIHVPEQMIIQGPIDLSPLRLTLLMSALVYLDGLWLHRHPYFAWAAGVCLATAGMGHNVTSINDNSVRLAQHSANAFDRLIPKTLAGWGVVSIAASFVLLAIGAAISLLRRPTPVIEEVNIESDGGGA